MERARFVERNGISILLLDFTGLDGEELRAEVDRASVMVRERARDSVLTLLLIGGVPYTLQNVKTLRDAAVQNSPFVRARAVVGLPEIAHLSFRAIAHLTGRKLESFEDAESAMRWLVEQAGRG